MPEARSWTGTTIALPGERSSRRVSHLIRQASRLLLAPELPEPSCPCRWCSASSLLSRSWPARRTLPMTSARRYRCRKSTSKRRHRCCLLLPCCGRRRLRLHRLNLLYRRRRPAALRQHHAALCQQHHPHHHQSAHSHTGRGTSTPTAGGAATARERSTSLGAPQCQAWTL